ncbi:MAG TPA: hypothetical protein VMH87_06575 [Pseudomonadales bacterium]|nr:hypothetical protein [Pseudomonadales bacterium]
MPFRITKKIAVIVTLCVVCLRSLAVDTSTSEPYQWRNVVIGGGGFVTGLITHPRAKNLIYARTDVGGAYRWDENSQRWIPITDSFGLEDFTGIESLALDPNDTNRIYLAAGIYEFTRSAIFRSDDRGRTWQRADVPFKMGGNETGRFNGERLVVSPTDGNVLFFGSRRDGLWKSTDRGVTWNPVTSFPKIAVPMPTNNIPRRFWNRSVGIICVLFDGQTIYAAVSTTGTNFFCSTDGGDHWQPVPGQPIGLRPNHVVLAADGILYLSYGKEPGPNQMTDGAVWKFNPATKSWTDITPLKSPEDGQTFGYGTVAVDAQNPAVLLTSTFCRWKQHDEIFRSTNAGASWSPLFAGATWDFSSAPYAGGIKPHWIGGIVISPSDSNRAWFTTGYGVWACTNLTASDSGASVHWNFSDDGFEETVPLALASPPIGAHLLSGVGDIDGFLHDDLNSSPPQGSYAGPHFTSTEDIAFAAGHPQIIVRTGIARGDSLHVALSTDGGKNWRLLDSEPSPDVPGGAVAISSDGRTIVVTKRRAASEFTTDAGKTWSVCNGLSPDIQPIADSVNPECFYAFDQNTDTLYVSTNGAANFQPVKFSFPFTPTPRGQGGFGVPDATLIATPEREGDLWLTCGTNGLWHSTDAGQSFAKIESVNTALAFGCGKAAPQGKAPAFFLFGNVTSQRGIFRSDDAGLTWLRLNDADHQFGWINHLTGDPRVFGRVYLATTGRGIIYGEPRVASIIGEK